MRYTYNMAAHSGLYLYTATVLSYTFNMTNHLKVFTSRRHRCRRRDDTAYAAATTTRRHHRHRRHAVAATAPT